jgi:hypothetical protein
MQKEVMLKAAGLVAMLWLASVIPASAQADGRFAGTVVDASGANVPNATITVKNEKTGEERTTTSNAQGMYVATSLKPLHQRRSRDVRNAHRHRGSHRRPRHSTAGTIRVQGEFLISCQSPVSSFQ